MRQAGFFAASLLSAARAAQDGVALTPPRGWRDWNEYQADISQDIMMGVMTLISTDSSRGPTLRDLGYTDVGLDDAWQKCGKYGPLNCACLD